MAAQNDHERVEQLLNELAEIGAGFFIEGIKVSQWRKIGMAISQTGMYGRECYELANTVAEDWNWHSMVSIVNFFLGKQPWEYTIDYLKSGVDGEYTLVDTGRKIRLSLTIEDIESDR